MYGHSPGTQESEDVNLPLPLNKLLCWIRTHLPNRKPGFSP